MAEENYINIYTGRKRLLTSRLPKQMQFPAFYGETLDETTFAQELSEILPLHNKNSNEFRFLRGYWLGDQPVLYREQGDREVNNKVIVNYAQAITRDTVGYTYAGGIQYVANDTKFTDEVRKINRMMSCEYRNAITKSMADNSSFGGTAFIGAFPDTLEKNEVPFELLDLSPIDTNVVYSVYNVNTPVYAFTVYSTKKHGVNFYVFQIWTNNTEYTFRSRSSYSVLHTDFIDARPHSLGEIPIIEYPNNQFRLGDWEFAIGLMNALNNVASDSVNDIEQTIISYLVLIGVEVDKEDLRLSKQGKLLVLPPSQGNNVDAKFITTSLDGNSVQLLRSYFEQALKFVVGVPDRDVGMGGSDTGISAEVRTGSGDLEIVAQNKVKFTEMAERRLLRIVLNILKGKKLISQEIQTYDIDIEIPRNKANNIQSKTQAGQILNEMGLDYSDIAKVMDLNTDITGLVLRWKSRKEKEKNQIVKPESKENIVVEKEAM